LELREFRRFYERSAKVRTAFEKVRAGEKLHVGGLCGSSRAFFASVAPLHVAAPTVCILPDNEAAAYFYEDLLALETPCLTLFFPPSCKKSVQSGLVVSDNVIMRAEALNRLREDVPVLLVTSPEAIVEKIITGEALRANTFEVNAGDRLNPNTVVELLAEMNFERTDFVSQPGQYAVRGTILDVYSYAGEDPFRLDFFGDTVDSIRIFDIATQISKAKTSQMLIVPNIQAVSEKKTASLFDFLSAESLLYIADVQFVTDILNSIYKETFRDFDVINGEDFLNAIGPFACMEVGGANFFKAPTVEFHTSPQPSFNRNFELLANNMTDNAQSGVQTFILSSNSAQIRRLRSILSEQRLNATFTGMNFTLHEGFIDHDANICCYTDHQIFERYHRYNLKSHGEQREVMTLKELNMLHPGDYVVHIDHGIGKFAGLVKTDFNGKVQEAARLVYRDNDVLLVNIHSLHRILKYKGKDGIDPKINKLGSGAWQKLKDRTKNKVKDIARELIALYAKRREEQGYAFAPDSYMQEELEASFMFEDTPDQVKTTQAVKQDMEREMPMDRLICGDVGFGKTEIAIRAAFKAATDGKQVAVLVPTTILALQHYRTFTERLENFPVTVDYISRLRSTPDVKAALKATAEGKVDILIGTHRIVGKDVKFKDLGLLIVDEEQKFGVSVKERLKQLKVNVDTLTLTATPIPRTLQFSLMGARDLSVIQTPPPNRYPIVTELCAFSDDVIREAVRNELSRNGQVFFINNRISNLQDIAVLIRQLVPEATVMTAHGQMDGEQLEDIMLKFINGRFDVLVSTAIIESGLDIPNANTMIINHAENFGLSDLHQLRGRVGRTNKKAYCYLLTPPLASLPSEARKRLQAIEEFSDLGSGFSIAMRDLDIRGAGNLLGAEQSGFIADIGFETYHRILNEAIQELKSDEFSELFTAEPPDSSAGNAFMQSSYVADCQIETDMELLLPDRYIHNVSERMSLYRDLDGMESSDALQQFELNLIDRFGPIPVPARELMEVVRLRWVAIRMGMERIILKGKKMVCYFVADSKSDYFRSDTFGRILAYMQRHPDHCRMREKDNKLGLYIDNIESVSAARKTLEKYETAE
jgi:transcription-repair coupling factor (superfamily II helicase)